MVYISMINRISFNYDINPAILNEGFFWFKDLSSPDPTGILPIMGGVISLLNILTTSTQNSSSVMRKIRKYIYVLPLISIPVWMTFPVVSTTIFSLSISGFQLVLANNVIRIISDTESISFRTFPCVYRYSWVFARKCPRTKQYEASNLKYWKPTESFKQQTLHGN